MQQKQIGEWYKTTADEFNHLYNEEDFACLRNYLEERIRFDLIQMVRRLGESVEFYFSVRQKTALSAYNKLLPALEKNQTELLKSGKTEFYLHDIIQDIVGCRIICIDPYSLHSVLRYFLQSESRKLIGETAELYRMSFRQFQPTEEGDYDIKATFSSIAGQEPAARSKKSLYESIHFHFFFASPYEQYPNSDIAAEVKNYNGLEAEAIRQSFTKLNEKAKKLIRLFPIEVQLRTFTEHIWAHDEHKFVYSPRKLGLATRDLEAEEQTTEVCIALKFALTHADRVRSLLRQINKEDIDNPIYAAGQTFEIDEARLRFFSSPELKNISEKIKKLDVELRRDVKPGPTTTVISSGTIPHYIDRLIKLDEEFRGVSGRSFFEYYPKNFDVTFWGQQRVVLMVVAFLFLFGVGNLRSQDPAKGVLGKAEDIHLDKLLVDHWGDVLEGEEDEINIILAGRIYGFIRAYDEYAVSQATTRDKTLFVDPLVYARFATSKYLLGQFGAAAAILDRVLNHTVSGVTAEWNMPRRPHHSERELRLRLIQYVWYDRFWNTNNLLDKIDTFEKEIKAILKIQSDDVSESYFKAHAWIALMIHCLKLMGTSLPAFFTRTLASCENVLILNSETLNKKFSKNDNHYVLAALGAALSNRDAEKAKVYLENAEAALAGSQHHPARAIEIQRRMFTAIMDKLFREEAVRASVPNVFVSYSHQDKKIVDHIVAGLSKSGITVLSDHSLAHTRGVLGTVESLIKEAKSAVMFVSEHYLKEGGWTQEERSSLQQLKRQGDIDIIVMLIDLSPDVMVRMAPLLADFFVIEVNSRAPESWNKNVDDLRKALLK